MRFSEFFHIKRDEDDDWFDPNLTLDTKLFIDPLLLCLLKVERGPRGIKN